MAWIESHQTLGRHPKTNRAAKALGITRPHLVGHLHFLWWWVLEYAPDGHLGKYEAPDIATAAEWPGDPDAFVDALLECGAGEPGFLRKDEDGLVVHDWLDYAGRMLEKRKLNAERVRLSRARNAHVTRTSHECNALPYRTVPYQREESSPPAPDSTKSEPEKPKGPEPEDLLRVWNENRGPMLGAKSLSEIRRRAAKARLHQEPDLAFWTTLARNLAVSPFHTGDNDRGWVADFDFFIRPKTLTQAKDGAFAPKGGRPTQSKLVYDPVANEARRREALGLDP